MSSKNWAILGVVLVVLYVIGARQQAVERAKDTQSPIEYQLALVDAGGLPDDVAINRFRSLLVNWTTSTRAATSLLRIRPLRLGRFSKTRASARASETSWKA
jgi:hypothetical protein